MSLIVAVHGVGNHVAGHPAEEIATAKAAQWAGHLATGLGGELAPGDVAFAYYAHHLRRGIPVAQGPADEALDHLTPEETETLEHWLEALELPRATAQGPAFVGHGVQALARHFSLDGRLTRAFVALFIREVHHYLRGPDAPVRRAVREEVASAVAAHRPRVVIAHSLGSVVAYEALHAHPELEVELLITLGSPLALPRAVFHRLLPGPVDGLGSRPPGVARWINVADPGDPVAVLRPLTRYFTGIDDNVRAALGPYAFHAAKHYLASGAVATALTPFLPGPRG